MQTRRGFLRNLLGAACVAVASKVQPWTVAAPKRPEVCGIFMFQGESDALSVGDRITITNSGLVDGVWRVTSASHENVWRGSWI